MALYSRQGKQTLSGIATVAKFFSGWKFLFGHVLWDFGDGIVVLECQWCISYFDYGNVKSSVRYGIVK